MHLMPKKEFPGRFSSLAWNLLPNSDMGPLTAQVSLVTSYCAGSRTKFRVSSRPSSWLAPTMIASGLISPSLTMS